MKVPKRSVSAKGAQQSGRPPSGSTSRPPSGSTSRPPSGSTSRPPSGSTSRPPVKRPASGPGLKRANGVERNPFSGLDSRVAIATTISKLESEGMTQGDGGVTDDEVVPLVATGIGTGFSVCLSVCLSSCFAHLSDLFIVMQKQPFAFSRLSFVLCKRRWIEYPLSVFRR